MEWAKTDPQDGVVTNLNVAYMDAEDETDFTAGVNSLWHGFELGYIYAHNKIDSFNTADFIANCDDNCWIADPGNYDIHTIHASFLFPNVMNMKNFNIYLGAYASWIESNPNNGDGREDSPLWRPAALQVFLLSNTEPAQRRLCAIQPPVATRRGSRSLSVP